MADCPKTVCDDLQEFLLACHISNVLPFITIFLSVSKLETSSTLFSRLFSRLCSHYSRCVPSPGHLLCKDNALLHFIAGFIFCFLSFGGCFRCGRVAVCHVAHFYTSCVFKSGLKKVLRKESALKLCVFG